MNEVMRIGLMMQGDRGWIGGSEYISNLILALASLPDEVRSTFEVCLFYRGKSLDREIFDRFQPYLHSACDLDVALAPPNLVDRAKRKIDTLLYQRSNPQLTDLLIAHQIDFVYPQLVSNRERVPYRGYPWIYDFQHQYLPEYCTPAEIAERDRAFAQIAASSAKVVVSSQTAAADFRKIFPNSNCQTEVMRFATSIQPSWFEGDPLETVEKYHLPDRFFIISNQFWQHKNHLVVLEALKILHTQSIYPVVVCTGHPYDRRRPDYIDTILQTIATNGLASQVYLLGLIPQIDRVRLVRHSLALIQPSLFEGWSTVVEDARCLGKKTILSDFPVHLEQNPPGSVFFDRDSPQQLANIMAGWWGKLSPGANPQAEKLAREQNIEAVSKFGYRFLELVKST